jgi:hypothetical protein
MSGYRRADDPEIACARQERAACEQRIESRALFAFFVVLLAAMLMAMRGSADVFDTWRTAASVVVG